MHLLFFLKVMASGIIVVIKAIAQIKRWDLNVLKFFEIHYHIISIWFWTKERSAQWMWKSFCAAASLEYKLHL